MGGGLGPGVHDHSGGCDVPSEPVGYHVVRRNHRHHLQADVTDTVCDNTGSSALAEQWQEYKVKHSKYSTPSSPCSGSVLAMIHTLADDFRTRGGEPLRIRVTSDQCARFLDVHVPRVETRTGQPLKRNILRTVMGEFGKLDRTSMSALQQVLA